MTGEERDEDGLTPFERMVFKGMEPPPPHLAALGQRFVDEAKPRFKNFRVDLEKIQSAAMAEGKAGKIAIGDARQLFLDNGETTSLPLVRCYVAACETELVARWLAALPSFHFAGWAIPRNIVALDGMVAAGEGALAVRTVRAHLKKVFDRAQAKWRLVARKRPGNLTPELSETYEANMAKSQWELPGEIEEARLEVADLERYVRDHGSHEDNRAIDTMLVELEKARGKFTPQ